MQEREREGEVGRDLKWRLMAQNEAKRQSLTVRLHMHHHGFKNSLYTEANKQRDFKQAYYLIEEQLVKQWLLIHASCYILERIREACLLNRHSNPLISRKEAH